MVFGRACARRIKYLHYLPRYACVSASVSRSLFAWLISVVNCIQETTEPDERKKILWLVYGDQMWIWNNIFVNIMMWMQWIQEQQQQEEEKQPVYKLQTENECAQKKWRNEHNSSSSMGPPTFIWPVWKNNHIVENIPIDIGGQHQQHTRTFIYTLHTIARIWNTLEFRRHCQQQSNNGFIKAIVVMIYARLIAAFNYTQKHTCMHTMYARAQVCEYSP